MERSLDIKAFPLGFRFHPTNEELMMYYLKRKVLGKYLGPQMISEVDVYKFEPWDLPDMACLKTKDRYWYFFCPRSKKYPSGDRMNRTTKRGYWKSTGEDKDVKYGERRVGKIKHLVFHSGKAPKGARTNWVMHEYVLNDTLLAHKGVPQDSYVICKLFEKSGAGPKNGEDYGARFVEQDWDSDTDDNVLERTSSLVFCDISCGCVGTPFTSVAAPDVPSPSTTTVIGTPFTSVAAPDVPSPSTTTVIGTPYVAATTSSTAAVMGTPYIAATTSSTTTAMDTPYVASTTPSATTVMGIPYIAAATSSTATVMGTPYISATTSLDFPIAAPLSLDVPKTASVLPSIEDEVDRLLQNFTEDAEDFRDIYKGLEDLGDLGNSFIEMNDLIR